MLHTNNRTTDSAPLAPTALAFEVSDPDTEKNQTTSASETPTTIQLPVPVLAETTPPAQSPKAAPAKPLPPKLSVHLAKNISSKKSGRPKESDRHKKNPTRPFARGYSVSQAINTTSPEPVEAEEDPIAIIRGICNADKSDQKIRSQTIERYRIQTYQFLRDCRTLAKKELNLDLATSLLDLLQTNFCDYIFRNYRPLAQGGRANSEIEYDAIIMSIREMILGHEELINKTLQVMASDKIPLPFRCIFLNENQIQPLFFMQLLHLNENLKVLQNHPNIVKNYLSPEQIQKLVFSSNESMEYFTSHHINEALPKVIDLISSACVNVKKQKVKKCSVGLNALEGLVYVIAILIYNDPTKSTPNTTALLEAFKISGEDGIRKIMSDGASLHDLYQVDTPFYLTGLRTLAPNLLPARVTSKAKKKGFPLCLGDTSQVDDAAVVQNARQKKRTIKTCFSPGSCSQYICSSRKIHYEGSFIV